ncbi:MAG: O-acetylhomoserine aminocarboxypropyltransferase [Alphaproteobacteria bacterium]
MSESSHFETLAVHAGATPDPTTKAVITPIYQTAAYAFDSAQAAAELFSLDRPGDFYSRGGNPTNAVLESRIAALEGGAGALAVASGLAAEFIAFHTLMDKGGHIVASNRLYGGSVSQLKHAWHNLGWQVSFVDLDDPAAIKAAITTKTRALFAESLANPGGVVTDMEALAEIAKGANIPLVIDNTLASPYLCRPIAHGADIVIHSATKFLGGHGNSMAGLIIDSGKFDWAKSGKYPALSQPNPSYNGKIFTEAFGKQAFIVGCRALGLRDFGPCLSPFNAFLILTGIETLHLRMARHCENALAIATWLQEHPKVARVNYAGLPDDKYYGRALKYLPWGAGAVFTFGLKGGYDSCVKLVERVKLFSHLANIGDTRSLIIHPASTTHSQVSPEAQRAVGIGPDVIRLSVGIEHAADLIADLAQGLE